MNSMLRPGRGGFAIPLRRIFLVLLMLPVAWVAVAKTVPEFVLFRERLLLNILEFESDVELRPVDLATHDGLSLRSWFHPPKPGKPVIVYFPGRLGDVIHKPAHLFDLAENGYGLMLAGYRGYGGNPGEPSEGLLYRDATTLLTRIAQENMAPDGLVLYGYSMGTGIASYVAAQSPSRAVILEAPFTSFGDVIRRHAASAPLWMVRTKFDTGSRMTSIDVPVLLMAGREDWITPPVFAERLAALNRPFASLHVFPGANHVNMMRFGGREAVSGFLVGIE